VNLSSGKDSLSRGLIFSAKLVMIIKAFDKGPIVDILDWSWSLEAELRQEYTKVSREYM